MPCSRCWSSISRRAVPRVLGLRLAAVALLAGSASQVAASELLALGQDHYYNQEYDQAVEAFERLREEDPENPRAYTLLAKGLLYREFSRLRLLDTGAFRGDPDFYEGTKPKPDPATNAAILGALREGRELCQRLLREDAAHRAALHGLAQLHALRASFELMIGKDYFGALASGRRARGLGYRVMQVHPEFIDGSLVAGLDEYLLGSLPWPVRALIALSGYRGRKKKGLEMIERVAREGQQNRHDARMLLTLVYRRERRYLDAASEFASLAREFPRAYAFPLEEAAMHRAADDRPRAVAILREVKRMRESGENNFGRMPAHWVGALGRTIEMLDEEIRDEGS